ncbi:hypothetical protein J1614_010958 [Plenodomus biglobosus]|nr:hypothetical protein J1614_010958 [Plenodomus biglobosus]
MNTALYRKNAAIQFATIRGQPCRVCGTPRLPPLVLQHPAEALCEEHGLPATTWQASLGRRLVGLLDDFVNLGGRPQSDETVTRFWRLLSLACHEMCELSLCEMAEELQQLWNFDKRNDRRIKSIREFKFWTGYDYVYVHCAFAIFCYDGTELVFDPTGIQFGPDWPLLSPLFEYQQKRFGAEPRRPDIKDGVLGRNKEWIKGGCKGRY